MSSNIDTSKPAGVVSYRDALETELPPGTAPSKSAEIKAVPNEPIAPRKGSKKEEIPIWKKVRRQSNCAVNLNTVDAIKCDMLIVYRGLRRCSVACTSDPCMDDKADGARDDNRLRSI